MPRFSPVSGIRPVLRTGGFRLCLKALYRSAAYSGALLQFLGASLYWGDYKK
jgi:hypothetical protein